MTEPIHLERLYGCARCGSDHAKISFQPLTHPVVVDDHIGDLVFTHWAPCPTNGEPILMTSVELEEPR